MVDELLEVRIRPATPDDAGEIARVHIASWREAYAGVVADEYLADLDASARADFWRGVLQDRHDVRVWVAEDEEDRHLHGFAALGPARDEDAERRTLEIYSMYLEPSAWGQGVARELLRTVVAAVPDGDPVTLWVLAANERARRFYRRHGFSPDGVERLESLGGVQHDEVRLRRG